MITNANAERLQEKNIKRKILYNTTIYLVNFTHGSQTWRTTKKQESKIYSQKKNIFFFQKERTNKP